MGGFLDAFTAECKAVGKGLRSSLLCKEHPKSLILWPDWLELPQIYPPGGGLGAPLGVKVLGSPLRGQGMGTLLWDGIPRSLCGGEGEKLNSIFSSS